MGYYTGAIFEIEHPAADSSIGGGGRYDNMAGKWSGTSAPAVGISLGIERILDLIPQQFGNSRALVLLASETFEAALAIQQELIQQGWNVRVDIAAKNQKAQLAELQLQGFTHFAILSGSEMPDVRPLG
jgi:histidyl-tRNA synthetase